MNGDDPNTFQEQLRGLLRIVTQDLSRTLVVVNLPDLTMLSRFRTSPSPSVTPARIEAFNRAIAEETRSAGGALVDLHASPIRDELLFDVDGFHPHTAGHQEIARQLSHMFLRPVDRR